jgi:hypothetical protein
MKKLTFALLMFTVVLLMAQTPKQSGTTKKNTATSPLVGIWKIINFQILKTPEEVPEDMKQQFAEKTIQIGKVQFKADSTYTSKMVEANDTGRYIYNQITQVVLITLSDKSVDTMLIRSLNETKLRADMKGHDGTSVSLEMERTQ